MKNICIIILVAIVAISLLNCNGGAIGVLKLEIISKEIHINSIRDSKQDSCSSSCPELHYRLVNNSKISVMLYNFNRYISFGYFPEELECDSVMTKNRLALFVFTDSMVMVQPGMHIPDSIENRPEAFRKNVARSKEWYRNSRVTLKGSELMEFSQTIDFRNFHTKLDLIPGTYYVKLLYRQSGRASLLTAEEIESDLKENDAYLFTGCLSSNPIRLVVH